jgi:hypothetical protein
MTLPTKTLQHFQSVVFVTWLPQDETGDRDDGVCAQDEHSGMTLSAGRSLLFSQSQSVCAGIFTRVRLPLDEVPRVDRERNTEAFE